MGEEKRLKAKTPSCHPLSFLMWEDGNLASANGAGEIPGAQAPDKTAQKYWDATAMEVNARRCGKSKKAMGSEQQRKKNTGGAHGKNE